MLRILLAALAVMYLFCFVGACATTGTGAAGIDAAEPAKTTDADVSDIRSTQAQVLWDNGFGKALGFKTFNDYLDTIPLVPRFSSEHEQRFPLLVLVDSRVNSMFACSLFKLYYSTLFWEPDILPDIYKRYEEKSISNDLYPGANDPKVYWIRVQDGRKSQGFLPGDAVKAFAADEVPLTAREGIATYAQHPEVVVKHHMYLPGSDHVCYGKHTIFVLGEWEGHLSLNHTTDAKVQLVTYGTPSRAK